MIGRLHPPEAAILGDDMVWTSEDEDLAAYLNVTWGRDMMTPAMPRAGHVAGAAQRLGVEFTIQRRKKPPKGAIH